jgi:hypothetical protein
MSSMAIRIGTRKTYIGNQRLKMRSNLAFVTFLRSHGLFAAFFSQFSLRDWSRLSKLAGQQRRSGRSRPHMGFGMSPW